VILQNHSIDLNCTSGAHVIATASNEQAGFVRPLGAAEIIEGRMFWPSSLFRHLEWLRIRLTMGKAAKLKRGEAQKGRSARGRIREPK
jgi:hypothetical protein